MLKKIIAHRGESYDAPENTLSSINLAWQRNVVAVEIDIRLTQDLEIVVIHDKNTKRLSGQNKTIKTSTLEQLRALSIGIHKAKKWESERIPTLSEVLQTVPEEGKLIIEIKSDDSILPILKKEIYSSGLKNNQIEIIAFRFSTLVKAKTIMPEFRMLWLLSLDYYLPSMFTFLNTNRIIKKLINHNIDGINVWAGKILTNEFIRKFKDKGFVVYTWTVNDPEKASFLLDAGIDGLTTDRASWMSKELLLMTNSL